jgi:signal transduction histidine kinase
MWKGIAFTSTNSDSSEVTATRSLPTVRSWMVIGTVIYGLFGLFDPSYMPIHLGTAYVIRLGITIPLMILLIAFTFVKGIDLAKIVFVFVTIPIVSINLLIAISNPEEHAYHVWFVGLIIGMVWLHNTGLPLPLLKIQYALIFILYNVAAIVFQKLPSHSLPQWLGNNSMLLTSVLFSYMASMIEQKNLSHEKQLKHELHKAVVQREKILHLISHDVKGPISSLRGLLLLYDRDAISQKELRENSKRVIENLDSLQELLDCTSLWAFNRGDAGFFARETLSVRDITSEVVDLCHSVAQKKGIILINKVNPDSLATADRAIVRAVLSNLVISAIRLTIAGHVEIKCKAGANGTTVTVEDTGQGLDDELIQIIRNGLHNDTFSNYSSKGFTLLLCKELIEKQGGSFSFMTSPMKGTSVTFTLPATPSRQIDHIKDTMGLK